MLKQVPANKTHFTEKEFIQCLIDGWSQQARSLPKKESVAVLYAQWGIETGAGLSCWNYNLGNIKAADAPGSTIEYCALTGVWEIINGQRVIIPPEKPGAWFRAFPTLQDGVNFYLQFLQKRYAKSWSAVEAGDPVLFAHLLKEQHYYTAPEADYAKGLNHYFTKFMNETVYEDCLPKPTRLSSLVSKVLSFFN